MTDWTANVGTASGTVAAQLLYNGAVAVWTSSTWIRPAVPPAKPAVPPAKARRAARQARLVRRAARQPGRAARHARRAS